MEKFVKITIKLIDDLELEIHHLRKHESQLYVQTKIKVREETIKELKNNLKNLPETFAQIETKIKN